MKYVIVQVSKFYVCITPAETGKQFVSSGNERNSKRPDYEVTFKEPLVVFLPDNLRGQAWNFPRELAETVRMAMRNAMNAKNRFFLFIVEIIKGFAISTNKNNGLILKHQIKVA